MIPSRITITSGLPSLFRSATAGIPCGVPGRSKMVLTIPIASSPKATSPLVTSGMPSPSRSATETAEKCWLWDSQVP
jgi:hypothetical protein